MPEGKRIFSDTERLYLLSCLMLVLLFSFFFLPANSLAVTVAVFSAIAAAAVSLLLKKRTVFSIRRGQVLLIMGSFAGLLLALYYLSGLHFGFMRTLDVLSLNKFLLYLLPLGVSIISCEIIRCVLLAQKSRSAQAAAFLICILIDMQTAESFRAPSSYNSFMDLVGMTLLPAVTLHLLGHYVSRRYGALPILLYRLPPAWIPYLIPFKSAIPDPLLSFIMLVLPLGIYAFIGMLFEKKPRYAREKKKRASKVVAYTGYVALFALMTAVMMVISCRFHFGALVISTESMTGELNKGDAIVYEQYGGETIAEETIIVFKINGSNVVHRVVDIERVNGQNRYFTKGDANEDKDAGYVTDAQIVGIVKWKIPYIGYPTIWVRQFFG